MVKNHLIAALNITLLDTQTHILILAQLDQFAHWIITILWFTVAHTHFQSDSIQYSTITSIIYTKPPLSSRVLSKEWSMCKCLCKVASIAVAPYCIQWLQTDYLHLYSKPAAKQIQTIFCPLWCLICNIDEASTSLGRGTHSATKSDTLCNCISFSFVCAGVLARSGQKLNGL